MKKSRAILGAVLGLALTVPLSPLTAEAAGGRWDQVDQKTRRYFVPDGQISKQRTVLSSSEKLVSTTTQAQQGRLIDSGVEKIGAVSTRDVENAAKDKVTTVPGAAEAIGNEWFEYETVKREKAYNRFYSQDERKYDLYAEQTRAAYTYQVTDKVRITETWTDPVTKQTQQNVADTNETRNEVRYSAWTETNKQIRVDAGTSTRTWGPDLVFVKVPDEQRIAKRQALTPPGGLEAGWWLMDTETFRFFVAGSTPPDGTRAATDAKAAEMRGSNEDWNLVNSETVRYFLAGATPPKGAVAANPDQKDAMVNPVNSGWLLANSELIRYFVPGITPPKDAKLADPATQAAVRAGVSEEWHLVNVDTFRNFIHGNVPPQDATRSDEKVGTDKAASGDWALDNVQSYRFFVPIPGDFENPIPPKPENPAAIVKLDAVTKYPAKAWNEYGEIRKERQGLLIRKFQPVTQVVPRTQTEITIHQAYNLQTYTTYEQRQIPVNMGGGTEMMSFQVPVKNYRWVLEEVNRTSREVPYANLEIALGDRELPSERANEVGSLAAANADRPGTFQGDSGSGGKAALVASKLREQMGANEVKASNIALTASQVEEAKRKADEQARAAAEEEKKRQAEEEAKRKAEREAAAKAEQERKAAEEAAEAAARAAAEAAQKAAEKQGKDAQKVAFTDAYNAAMAAMEASRKTLTETFSGELQNVIDMLEPFDMTKGKGKGKGKGNDKAAELEKKQADLLKDYQKKVADLAGEFEKKTKDIKDLVTLDEWKRQYQKKLADLQKEMNDKVKSMHKEVAEAIVGHVSDGGTMRTGEEANVNGQSVRAYYSHDTGRWILLGYPSKDYKGDPVILDTGINPRQNGKDTPILPEFTYNGVKLGFEVDHYTTWFFGTIHNYDARVYKK